MYNILNSYILIETFERIVFLLKRVIGNVLQPRTFRTQKFVEVDLIWLLIYIVHNVKLRRMLIVWGKLVFTVMVRWLLLLCEVPHDILWLDSVVISNDFVTLMVKGVVEVEITLSRLAHLAVPISIITLVECAWGLFLHFGMEIKRTSGYVFIIVVPPHHTFIRIQNTSEGRIIIIVSAFAAGCLTWHDALSDALYSIDPYASIRNDLVRKLITYLVKLFDAELSIHLHQLLRRTLGVLTVNPRLIKLVFNFP